jgi:asparagine synthase (glutamine-hydrolysing)
VPFVDHTLVEAVAAMPLRYKLRWRSPLHHARALLSYSDVFAERDDTTKYILRRAFADALPREVVERRKVGFKVPLERWFRGDLMGYARELLLSKEARRRGVIDVEALGRWLDRGPANGGEFGQKVWMLVNLELWFRVYFPDGETLDIRDADERTAAGVKG